MRSAMERPMALWKSEHDSAYGSTLRSPGQHLDLAVLIALAVTPGLRLAWLVGIRSSCQPQHRVVHCRGICCLIGLSLRSRSPHRRHNTLGRSRRICVDLGWRGDVELAAARGSAIRPHNDDPVDQINDQGRAPLVAQRADALRGKRKPAT